MWDALFTSVLALLAALMAIDAFQTSRRNRKALFAASAMLALAAAPVFMIDWPSGFYLLVLSPILRFVAAMIASRSA